MWYVLFGDFGEDVVAEFETEEEANAFIEAQSCPDDYWLGTDDVFGFDSDIDSDFGFDPYMGEFTYDC